MDADGTHVEQLTRSPVSEFCPVVLDDGRVMYHRWEYIDKGARVAKTIWAMNPDGSRPQELYGLADDDTTVYMYPQPLPGNSHRFVCVGTCHFPQGGCLGAILLVDFGMGVRGRGLDPDEPGYVQWDDRYPVVNITPHVFVERRTEPGWHFLTKEGGYVHDSNGQKGHLYTHPYPVSDREFLVSYKVNPADHYKEVANAYALYLVDVDGRHRLVHADPKLSCWHPLPLVARRVPPAVQGVARTAIRRQRPGPVHREQRLPGNGRRRAGSGQMVAHQRGAAALLVHRPALGTVAEQFQLEGRPVAAGAVGRRARGSRRFRPFPGARQSQHLLPGPGQGLQGTPAGADVCELRGRRGPFLHGLSRAIQPDRSRPARPPRRWRCCGRRASLSRNRAIWSRTAATACAGQVIHYPADIQPMFDAKCVSCHGASEPAGGLRLTGEITEFYNTSYEELARKQLAGPIIPEFTSFLCGRPRQLQRRVPAAPAPGLPHQPADRRVDQFRASEERQGRPYPDADGEGTDGLEPLGGYQLPVLRQLLRPPASAVGQSGSRRSRLRSAADFRRKPTFEEATSFLAPEWHR